MQRSKKYRAANEKVEAGKAYTIEEAIKLAKETSYTKFPGSLELVLNLNVPTKLQNESIRGSVILPNQVGEGKKVLVIAEAQDQKTAEKAGADAVGGEEMIEKVEKGFSEFDILIATPQMMPKLAKLGKVLGPKGLMPNPKNETVTTDIEKVVKSYKAGKTDFRVNEQGSIKARVGKLDQSDEELMQNTEAFIKAVDQEVKRLGQNRYNNVYMAATMGPSIKIEVNSLLQFV